MSEEASDSESESELEDGANGEGQLRDTGKKYKLVEDWLETLNLNETETFGC